MVVGISTLVPQDYLSAYLDCVILLASSDGNLYLAGWFAAKCESTVMRISWKPCLLEKGSKAQSTLFHPGKGWIAHFKLGMSYCTNWRNFTISIFGESGVGERQIDWWGVAGIWMLHLFAVVKIEKNVKVKMSVSYSVYIPTLTYGYEL